MMTIGALARKSGLARASLLYYEAQGLLIPAGRSASGYRLYGEAELARLAQIRRYRDAGLPVAGIKRLMEQKDAGKAATGPAGILADRLMRIADEIVALKRQQRVVARLLATPEMQAGIACRGKAEWTALLAKAGFSDAEMWTWHAEFERLDAAGHRDFLASLGLAEAEIKAIRKASR